MRTLALAALVLVSGFRSQASGFGLQAPGLGLQPPGLGRQAPGLGPEAPDARSLTPGATYLLIIVGLAGDPEHGELFTKWAQTLATTAEQRLAVAKDDIVLLDGAAATREGVAAAFAKVAAKASDDDTVAVVLFGHGTYAGKVAKFNLPGPDMAPEDFARLLATLKSKRVVFVDTASASGPFVDVLSAPGRIVVAATRNGAEQYATLFGGPFVEAFATDAADANRDGTVTILEAFEYAKHQVEAAFQREGLLQTEHAVVSDTAGAGTVGLGASRAQALPDDPALRALYVQRQDLERRIESLRLLKAGMDPDKYAAELEKLATELAEKTRQIRTAEGKK